MSSLSGKFGIAALTVMTGLTTLVIAMPQSAQAQSKGKIVCWKDKSGKVMGCGDTVPPE